MNANAPTTEPLANYVPEAERFARKLKKEWIGVQYDRASERGSAHVGSMGKVTFYESGSDPAVVVQTAPLYFKGTADEAAKFIQAIHDIMSRL